jgi:hypothetical protein
MFGLLRTLANGITRRANTRAKGSTRNTPDNRADRTTNGPDGGPGPDTRSGSNQGTRLAALLPGITGRRLGWRLSALPARFAPLFGLLFNIKRTMLLHKRLNL